MVYVYLIFGVVIIGIGLLTRKTKDYWKTRAPERRPVDVEKYTKFMCAIGVGAGSLCILMGLLELSVTVPIEMPLILSISYFISTIYCERKYGRNARKK
jgi:hypothetical protein